MKISAIRRPRAGSLYRDGVSSWRSGWRASPGARTPIVAPPSQRTARWCSRGVAEFYLQLRQSDQLIELGGILPQRLARPVIDDAAAVHHHGARRDVERDAGVLLHQDEREALGLRELLHRP